MKFKVGDKVKWFAGGDTIYTVMKVDPLRGVILSWRDVDNLDGSLDFHWTKESHITLHEAAPGPKPEKRFFVSPLHTACTLEKAQEAAATLLRGNHQEVYIFEAVEKHVRKPPPIEKILL